VERITVEKAKDGSVIGKDVYAITGELLVKKGTTFREPYLPRLLKHGVQDIYLENPETSTKENSDILIKETITDVRQKLNIHDVINDKTRVHAHQQMKKTLGGLSAVSNSNLYLIKRMVEEMIEEMLQKKDFVLTLSQMRSIDDYTYQHSVNVGVLSLLIGIDMDLSKDKLKELGIGAMLHDVGKTMIPEDIIKKTSKLTKEEYRQVQKHTEYGYEMLCQTDISQEAAQIALFHHEKYDGTGYGRGLKESTIPYLARIVAVADVYDAMSNDRVYQRKSSHDKVFREVTHLGNTHFDTVIMETFAKRLNIYPTGTGIILNTGQRGVVLGQNTLYLESPLVRIFTPTSRNIKELYFDLDLSLNKGYFIVDTF
jgi:HD-GYP domain-containing protein (c-di-GMP phosphodiesterase class II)